MNVSSSCSSSAVVSTVKHELSAHTRSLLGKRYLCSSALPDPSIAVQRKGVLIYVCACVVGSLSVST